MKLKSFAALFFLVSLSATASADRYPHQRCFPVWLRAAKNNVVEKKKAAIKIYPNPSTDGTVRVVSNTAGKLNFYIFDMDGTLLHQAVIHENEKHTITDLKKGVYTYDAFYKDEGIDHGKLIVK